MRRISRILSGALLAAPAVAWAQGEMSAAAMPQYVSMKIGTGTAAKTVSQMTVPLVAVVPFGARFNIDIASAFATSEVRVNGNKASSISGPTDTQIRANWTLGNDAVVFTLGVNAPTGQYKINQQTEADAAGQIGNDFIIYPTSSYGAGLSGTGGVAMAWTWGSWNVGLGGSARVGSQFDAYTSATDTGAALTFTPANEYRARFGVDRYVGSGRLALGLTFSTFGKDELANTSYKTGARYIGQGSYSVPVGSNELYLSGWALLRQKGEQYGGVAPGETVLNASAGLGMHFGSWYVEPNVEARNWQIDGVKAGLLANGGVRVRMNAGAFTIMPSATYQVGNLYDLADGTPTDLNGWRAALTIRLR